MHSIVGRGSLLVCIWVGRECGPEASNCLGFLQSRSYRSVQSHLNGSSPSRCPLTLRSRPPSCSTSSVPWTCRAILFARERHGPQGHGSLESHGHRGRQTDRNPKPMPCGAVSVQHVCCSHILLGFRINRYAIPLSQGIDE